MRTSIRPVAAAALAVALWSGPAAAQVSELTPPADLAAPPADATKSATGLISRVVTPGKSTEKPAATDIVTVNYTAGPPATAGCSTAPWRGATPPPFR
jgi:peptidylprolyl isomerase